MLAHVLSAILKNQEITLAELIERSSLDGEHFIDQKFLRKILHGESFPDYDTFANLLDGLLELAAVPLLVLKKLEYVYTEESMAWDRSYRDESGRVSETRPQGDRPQKPTERSERTTSPESSNESEERDNDGDDPVGERGFEPLSG